MKTLRTLAAAALLLGLALSAMAGEPTAETLLPVHNDRDAFTPGAAFGSDVFLVAWQSGRNGPGDLRKGLNLIGDVVGCRVDKSGKPLDEKPFAICEAPDQQEDVHVAFGRDVFLVVWADIRNGKDWDVYAARVAPDGKVLDKDGFLVSGGDPSSPGGSAAASHNQAKPRVCWDGKAFVIVWQDLRSGGYYAICTARVSPEGKVLDPEGVKVASGGFYHCFTPALASAGGGRSFVVHVAEGQPVDGYRCPGSQGWFIVDGKPDDKPAYVQNDKGNPKAKEEGKQGPDGRSDPMAMAAGGGAYMVSWKNDSSLGRGFGPDGNGALFDDKGLRKASPHFSGGQGKRDSKRICSSSVAWEGSAFVVAWHEFVREDMNGCPADAVFAQRVGPDGKAQGEPVRVAGTFANPASSPAAASNGSGLTLVAYEKHPAKGDEPIKIAFRMLSGK